MKAEAHYAVLALDGGRLALPQSDLRALEPAVDVEYVAPAAGAARCAVGWIDAAGCRCPVYCIDGELDPLRDVPAARRICVLLQAGDRRFGLLCDDLGLLPSRAVQRHELPPAMALEGTLLRGVLVHDGAGIPLSAAEALATRLWANETESAAELAPKPASAAGGRA